MYFDTTVNTNKTKVTLEVIKKIRLFQTFYLQKCRHVCHFCSRHYSTSIIATYFFGIFFGIEMSQQPYSKPDFDLIFVPLLHRELITIQRHSRRFQVIFWKMFPFRPFLLNWQLLSMSNNSSQHQKTRSNGNQTKRSETIYKHQFWFVKKLIILQTLFDELEVMFCISFRIVKANGSWWSQVGGCNVCDYL